MLDHGVKQADGSWALASGTAIVDAAGQVIAAPTLADVLAQAKPTGTAWTTEEIGFNPYADIAVEKIGINIDKCNSAANDNSVWRVAA